VSGLLVAGTSSDAGKSVVTTGLCRALARRGVRVAPFKAQNMSNNSMVCLDGDEPVEIGRAQWIQARAARVDPEPAMNPVLLKPGSDRRSHVLLRGRPAGHLEAADFASRRPVLEEAAYAAWDDLARRFDVVVAEGAGSPAEINLRAGDFVNLGLARYAGLPVVVVGDIDRGGVFASFLGTVALLEPADQALVAGFVVNKFRGDRELLRPGLDRLRRLTGRPTYGVLPWHPDLWLDSEDALDVASRRSDGAGVRVAVLRLPRISNFTDVDALALEPDVDVAFVTRPAELVGADLVVLPGTRATVADLGWIRERGLDTALAAHVRQGGAVLGICGGAQLLGGAIEDPDGVEGPAGVSTGLGLVAGTTRFAADKVLGLPVGTWRGARVVGYEIHHGRLGAAGEPFPGGVRVGRVFATMWHGSLECDDFRQALLAEVVPGRRPSAVRFAAHRAERLDLLGDMVEEHLDVDALLDLARGGPPADLPVLPPAGG
jgi:adenosylcobyric acid synthase